MSLCLSSPMKEFLGCFRQGKDRDFFSRIGMERCTIDDADGTTLRGMQNLAKGPPCANYEQLVVLEELEALLPLLEDANVETDADIKSIQQQFADMKSPLLDLVAKGKRASQDIQAARKVSGRSKREKGASSPAVEAAWSIWSADTPSIIDIATIACGGPFDPSIPALISRSDVGTEVCHNSLCS